jgi:hypothetical protein
MATYNRLALASTQQRLTVMPSLLSLIGAFIALVTMATSCLAGALTDIPGADDKQGSLTAYLARPSGAGPFPAVVVLHGCNGFDGLVVGWADRLARWGYAALAIDSLTPHSATIATACAGGFLEQPVDAYQGLKFLAAQPFVRADRIAVLGASMGGKSVLTALERGLIEPMFRPQRRAGTWSTARAPSGRHASPETARWSTWSSIPTPITRSMPPACRLATATSVTGCSTTRLQPRTLSTASTTSLSAPSRVLTDEWRPVTHEAKTVDRDGRTVALCRAGGRDIGAAMVLAAMALAVTRGREDYVELEAQAMRARIALCN